MSDKMNNITGNFYSDEWYTDQKTVNKCIELLNLKGHEVVMCPFDSENSLFVKTLREMNHTVIYGIQDFIESNYLYDVLVTNPPFSIKDTVIEKVLQSGKKSVLVLPLDSVGGVKRHALYAKFGYPSVYIPTRRVSYFDTEWNKKEGSNFHSIIMKFNDGEPELIWEQIATGDTNESNE